MGWKFCFAPGPLLGALVLSALVVAKADEPVPAAKPGAGSSTPSNSQKAEWEVTEKNLMAEAEAKRKLDRAKMQAALARSKEQSQTSEINTMPSAKAKEKESVVPVDANPDVNKQMK